MTVRHIAAIDIGASSGRVMLATYHNGEQSLGLQEIHRFTNQLKHIDHHCYWDLERIETEIRIGLNKITDQNIQLDSIGIDTWGVDYVLLDKNGHVIAPTYSYRDHRTDSVMTKVQQDLSAQLIYQKTGIQFLTFNTLYQLKAMVDEKPSYLKDVAHFLMIPDYLIYRLTGQFNCEYTNATTTQLVNVETKSWDDGLLSYLGIPTSWFGEIKHPGNQVGYWLSDNGKKVPVISVASHDTASAVIASPLQNKHSAYLCSGTWSLMGIETTSALTDAISRSANITNEGGVFEHYRVLKNIMGLWLFQRICHENNVSDICQLIEQAEKEPAYQCLVDPNDDRFLNPESMTEMIKTICGENKQFIPQTNAALARCIFDSLAMFYGAVISELATLIKKPITQLNIVGGGSQNDFLNQLCADICQIPIIAGPIEASTLGNVGMQLITLGDIDGVDDLRKVITKNFSIKKFIPNKR
ncbi:rhamnulokinase [Orbus mooreae]|uniref:rhamnulokinase n=1 Tax=Orbus mooreae TaxID=3074107 RepID=UPI00370D8A22